MREHETGPTHAQLVRKTLRRGYTTVSVRLLFSYCVILKPIILLFSVGTLGYLHHLPLYYKSLVYYCLGPVVKSPVL
jgi:hypothetical protein